MNERPSVDSVWEGDLTHPDQKEQRFLDLLRDSDAVADPTYTAELLTQLARTQGLQGRFDQAHATLERARPLLGDAEPRALVRYHLERGRVFNSSGDRARAKPEFAQAWELASAHGEQYLAVDAAHMLGIVEEPNAQLDWNLRALAMADASEDTRTREWSGSLYNNIGWTYHDRGEYELALDYFTRSLTFRQMQGRPREIRIARWTVARTLRSLGCCEEALAIQQDNLQLVQESGEPDGFIQEELGECLLALDRTEEARVHFARAFTVLSDDPWLSEHEPERLQRLHRLSVDPSLSIEMN